MTGSYMANWKSCIGTACDKKKRLNETTKNRFLVHRRKPHIYVF